MVVVKFKRVHPDGRVPANKDYKENSGYDLFSIEDVMIRPGHYTRVRTGIAVEVPPGYDMQCRPRSGMAVKGLLQMPAIGTIDPGYRGEILIGLRNMTSDTIVVKAGDRIAQLVLGQYAPIAWAEADELSTSVRGEGGFGSTGR